MLSSVLKTRVLSILVLLIVAITACENRSEAELEIAGEAHQVLIDIDVEQLLTNARVGDEVPDMVQMYNGAPNHLAGTEGEANLTTEVMPGDELIWQLGDADGVTITGFEFFVIKGVDVLELPGSQQPVLQTDGSWKARISPNAQGESVLKYNVHFEVGGKNYWWDPLIKITSNNPNP